MCTTEPRIFFWIAAFIADSIAVNTNGIKTILADGWSTFFNGKSVLSNSPKILPRSPLCYFRILSICKFILADEFFAKALQTFAACLLNHPLYGKLVSPLELPIIFDGNLRITPVLFFVADFNLLDCESDSFTICVTLNWCVFH